MNDFMLYNMLTALHFAGSVVHPPHSVSLSRDLRVPASVFEDGGWKGGRGGHPDIQEHGAEDRDRVTTDKIVRKKFYCTLRCQWQISTMGLFMCTLMKLLTKTVLHSNLRIILHTYRRQPFLIFLICPQDSNSHPASESQAWNTSSGQASCSLHPCHL